MRVLRLAALAAAWLVAIPSLSLSQTTATVDRGSAQTDNRPSKEAELRRLTLEIETRLGSGTRYVTLATPESSLVEYVAAYKQELAKLGTKEYPKRDGKSVYGRVVTHITLDANGNVESTEPVGTGDPFLLRHARRLVAQMPNQPAKPGSCSC